MFKNIRRQKKCTGFKERYRTVWWWNWNQKAEHFWSGCVRRIGRWRGFRRVWERFRGIRRVRGVWGVRKFRRIRPIRGIGGIRGVRGVSGIWGFSGVGWIWSSVNHLRMFWSLIFLPAKDIWYLFGWHSASIFLYDLIFIPFFLAKLTDNKERVRVI